MNNWSADKSVCLLLAAILFSSSRILFAGSEPLATDGKDYSKEVVPVEKELVRNSAIVGNPGRCSRVVGGYIRRKWSPGNS